VKTLFSTSYNFGKMEAMLPKQYQQKSFMLP